MVHPSFHPIVDQAVIGAPEGPWSFVSERRPAALTFNPDLVTKLVVAKIPNGSVPGVSESTFILWNAHTALFIYPASMSEREPLRRIDFRQAGQSVTPYITALDYTSDAEDEFDLAVGMSNGEVKVFSLAAQLSVRGPKPTLDGPVLSTTPSTGTNSRCLSVTWEPMAKGRRLVSIHADGSVRLEEKIGGPEDLPVLQPSMALRPTDILESATWSANSVSATATAAAPSPCGRYLALACRDGTLRVFSLSTGVLYGGCSSYYGGLLCLAWSPDGRYIAAGGEDDLIFLWSAEDNRLVAHLEGHLSYITAVAFDGESPGVPYSYRVASVAMDCALGLWEVNCGEGAEVTTPRAIHATHTVQGDSPVGGRGTSGTVLPPVPRAAMTFVSPLSLQKVHGEPLCDVKFLKNSLLVASNDGTVKRWRRPVHVVAG